MPPEHTKIYSNPVSLLSATLLVVASMIGTGVFTTLGLQLTGVHSLAAVLLLWVAGGASAFCGALAYGELGAMMPRSGGEYTYLGNIYHPAVGFLSGCASMVAGFGAPIALAAIASGYYIHAVFPGIDKTAAGVLAITVLTVVHLVDVRLGCQFQNVFTVGKIMLIAAFIGAGLFTAHPQQVLPHGSGNVPGTVFSPAFAVGLVYVSYAYSGWNASAYVAGEIQKPERNLPIALFAGTLFVSVCYVLLNFIFLYTVPVRELTGRIDVAYLSGKAIFGGTGAKIVTLLVCLALISTLSSMIMAGPRVIQAMGEDLRAMRVFAAKNKRGSPVYAIILQASIALFLVFTSTFDAVLTYVGFTLTLFAFLAVLGVIVLRVREPEAKRPFRMWGYPVTPIFFLVLNGWMLCFLVVQRPLSSIIGLLTLACSLVLYALLAKKTKWAPL